MLIATLNHNLPKLTDNLVNQLKRDPLFTQCELMVVDNGSSEPLAKSTTHSLEQNIFFGGGFNTVLEYFLTLFLIVTLKSATIFIFVCRRNSWTANSANHPSQLASQPLISVFITVVYV